MCLMLLLSFTKTGMVAHGAAATVRVMSTHFPDASCTRRRRRAFSSATGATTAPRVLLVGGGPPRPFLVAQTQHRLEAIEKAREAAIKSLEQAAVRGSSTSRRTPQS